ncbi:MAG TPA: TlpA disulfide reductase family protein [Acidimicrobiia bacterium]
MAHLRDKGPSERTPEWLIGLLIAVVVVTVGWFFLRSIGAGDDPVLGDDAPPGESSESVDGDFLLYNGTPATFEDFEGPLVVNFWASWCPACIVELPDFQAVSAELGDSVTFIGMNVLPDDREAAEALIARTGVEYQLALDDGGALYAEFGGIAMPTTVFLDADGNVVDVHSGTLFEADLRERISELFGV